MISTPVAQNLVDSLEELSSLHIQTHLWSGGVPGMVGSYVESVCGIFDDSGYGEGYYKGFPKLSCALETLSQAVDRVDDVDADGLHSKAMDDIRQSASVALELAVKALDVKPSLSDRLNKRLRK